MTSNWLLFQIYSWLTLSDPQCFVYDKCHDVLAQSKDGGCHGDVLSFVDGINH